MCLPIVWKALYMQIHWHAMVRMMCDCCGCCIMSMCYAESAGIGRSDCMMAEHSSPWRCTKTTLIHTDCFYCLLTLFISWKFAFCPSNVEMIDFSTTGKLILTTTSRAVLSTFKNCTQFLSLNRWLIHRRLWNYFPRSTWTDDECGVERACVT